MKECFECGATEDIQDHHVVPRSRGGTKTVPLCYSCHCKAHGRDAKGMRHGLLTKQGIAKAKANGVKMGTRNPKVMEAVKKRRAWERAYILERVEPYILEARSLGIVRLTDVVKFLNDRGVLSSRGNKWSKGTLHRIFKMVTEDK